MSNPRMSEEALLEAVRGLRVADPDLGLKPLLAKLREQQPDLGAATREVREALTALKAEREAAKAAAAPLPVSLSLACIGCARLPSDMDDEREKHPICSMCRDEKLPTTFFCGEDCPANPGAWELHGAFHKKLRRQRKMKKVDVAEAAFHAAVAEWPPLSVAEWPPLPSLTLAQKVGAINAELGLPEQPVSEAIAQANAVVGLQPSGTLLEQGGRLLHELGLQPAPAADPPGAVASEAAMVEEPRTLSSLPAELLTLVAEILDGQCLAHFAAASTVCLAAAQGELRVALITAVEAMELAEVVAALRVHVAVARVAEGACLRLAVLSCPSLSAQAAATAAEAGALEAVVEAMRAHPQVAGVQEHGCRTLNNVCGGINAVARAYRQRAAEAGALEAVVEAMQAHPQVVSVQEHGCQTLRNVCSGINAAARAYRQRAAEAGALEAVVAAMQAHPQVVSVQEHGCQTLRNVCSGINAAGLAYKQRAAEAGALEAVVAAMQAHPQVVDLQEHASATLIDVCWGEDAAGLAYKQRAVEAGALEAVVAAMQAYPQVVGVQEHGCMALVNMCRGIDAAAPARRQRAAEAGALEAVVEALQAHPQVASVQQWGCAALQGICGGDDAAASARSQHAVEAGALEAVPEVWRRMQLAAPPSAAPPEVAGLAELLGSANASHKLEAAAAWCMEQGADSVAELAGYEGEFAAALSLPRIKHENLLKALKAEAMQAHPQVAGVQEHGCRTLNNVCGGDDAAAPARRQRAAEAGALEAVVAAMWTHLQVSGVQGQGCMALRSMCCGDDAAALARRQRALEAGAVEAARIGEDIPVGSWWDQI